MLVLAGPGSGKTSVLISRLLQLTDKHHVRSQEILAVTFTRAAAKEMKERYLKESRASSTAITFGTLHGVFFAILREAEKGNPKRLLAGEEKQKLLQDILQSLGQDMTDSREQVKLLEQEISRMKHMADGKETFVPGSLEPEEFRKAFTAYQSALSHMDGMDFDDMAHRTLQLFRENPRICRRWQQRFSHILVDEFQDIDLQQYALLKILASPQDNLFMVGDDDQSIYGFRGADPSVMQKVTSDFPQLQTVVLDVNYRCQKQIIACAGQLIKHNQERFLKNVRPATDKEGMVLFWREKDRQSEWERIATDIDSELQNGRNPAQIAVLTRTAKGQEGVQMALLKRGIACDADKRGVLPTDSFIWKDLKAYLLIAAGERGRQAYLQILNRPERFLPRNALKGEQISWPESVNTADPVTARHLLQLKLETEGARNLVPAAALYYIRRHIGYEEWLKQLACRQGRDPTLYLMLLELLQKLAAGEKALKPYIEAVEAYRLPEAEKAVQLMTLHGAKGLEYEVVYIPDVNTGNIPWKEAKRKSGIEEERRLLYVGMTRAKEKLVLSSVQNEQDGAVVSPFFTEAMPEEKKAMSNSKNSRI